MSEPISQFLFRGHHRHVMILPRSQPKPSGFTLAVANEISGHSGVVREISPHLAKDRNALMHGQTLLAAIGLSCALGARTIAMQLSKAIEQGLLNVYVESIKASLHTSTEVASPVGASTSNKPQGKASPKGKQSQPQPASGEQANYTQTDVAIGEQVCRSDPISMFSGEEILPLVDFNIEGVMPLVWRRLYRSSRADTNVGLGYGWRHNFSVQLEQKVQSAPKVGPKQQDKHWLELTDDEGRVHVFEQVKIGQTSYQLSSGLALIYQAEDKQVLVKPDDTHWTFKRCHRDTGCSWLLDTISNLQGQYFALQYDTKQRLTSISIAPHRGLILQYDAYDCLVSVQAYFVDGEGKQQVLPKPLARYGYDAKRALTVARNHLAETEQYHYQYVFGETSISDLDSEEPDMAVVFLLKKRTRSSGFSHHFQWQLQGTSSQCIKQWGDEASYQYHFSYQSHPSGRVTTSTDSLGNTERFVHSPQGKLLEFHDANGHISRYRYDSLGRKIAETNAMGALTQYEYNLQGQLSALVAADGTVTRYQYNALGQRIVTIDPLGGKHLRRFDATGRLLSEQLVDGRQRQYRYNDNGQLTEFVDEYGRKKSHFWGANGELLAQQQGAKLTRYSYDSMGRINASIDGHGIVTETVRDTVGRVSAYRCYSQQHQHEQIVSEFEYDTAGRMISALTPTMVIQKGADKANDCSKPRPVIASAQESDEAVSRKSWCYQGLAQPSAMQFEDGSRLQYCYDSERNLTQIIRSDGAQYSLQYSKTEQITQLIGFDGRQQDFTYDAADRLSAISDSGMRHIALKRDLLGRVVQQSSVVLSNKSTQPISSLSVQNNFHYDALGRVVKAHNGHSQLALTYHLNGKVSQSTQGAWKIGYRYNAQGLRESMQLPDGSIIQYEYDEHAQLASMALAHSGRDSQSKLIVTRQYDDAGLLVTQKMGNDVTLKQQFDRFSRLNEQRWCHKQVGEVEFRCYQYDAEGQLQCRQTSASAKDEDTQTDRFSYNSINQLVAVERESHVAGKADIIESTAYQWDGFGNPQSASAANSHHQSSVNSSARPISVSHDRLLSRFDSHFSYDDSGNQTHITAAGVRQYRQFNGLNQLVEINHNGKLTRYQYDALGRRTAKLTERSRTDYLWDGDQLVGEHTQGQYRWYLYEPDSFSPIACVESEQIYWYHLDQLGTPCTVLNGQGKMVWQHFADPFGLAVADSQPIADSFDNPLRFQGQYFDAESGLHYNRYRYYSPQQQRFINQDPIGLAGGINPYQYAPNPVNWIDPLGLSCKEVEDKETNKARPNKHITPELESKLIEVAQIAQSPYTADEIVESVSKVDHIITISSGESAIRENRPRKKPKKDDVNLAKSTGSSLEQIEARRNVTLDYMSKNGFSEDQIFDALGSPDGTKEGGFDLTKPVEVINFPPPDSMTQYVAQHGYPGNWFDPLSSQSPDELGISGEGRTLKSFKVVEGTGLMSTAKPVVDTWTVPGKALVTNGGGIQLLVNDSVKSAISKINVIGI